MKRKIYEIILIILFYLLQVSLSRIIAIADIIPNFLIILPVVAGFFNGRNEGMFVGFFAGVMYDLFFSELFGFSALVFTYIGYISGSFYKKYEKKEMLVPIALVLASDFVYEFLSFIGRFLLQNRLNAGYFLSRFILPEVVYTLIVVLILYKPLEYLDEKINVSWFVKRKGRIDERNI
ncbi:MAG: rod shape-determining protein MreD [Lachnospira sp.]